MHISLFDFELPEDRIAVVQADPRDTARMLCVKPDGLVDAYVRDLVDFLEAGDALVLNDTRVIPARLKALRERLGASGSLIDITLVRRLSGENWQALVRPAKRLKTGDTLKFLHPDNTPANGLEATVTAKDDGGMVSMAFNCSREALDNAIEKAGVMPLPPYIAAKRTPDASDDTAYQTLYARNLGAVAAPTAGLHFTEDLLERLKAKGVNIHCVTLHVGMGTFLPVKVDDTENHVMHAEWGSISAEVAQSLNAVRAAGKRIVAVGTTSVRVLETAANEDGSFAQWAGDTAIFITPGYRFKAVDVLMTNFHLPRSTLFMLVSAFAGLDEMRSAYQHAIDNRYRFYSYGDSTLLYRRNPTQGVTHE